MTNVNCPICKSQATEEPRTFDGQKLSCPKCGDFSIVDTASETWKNKELSSRQIANACGWIRERQGISINSDQIEHLLSVATPSVSERATKILIAINNQSEDISHKFGLHTHDANYWLGVSYSKNPDELFYLLKTFLNETVGYISYSRGFEGVFTDIQVTPKGYEYLESLNYRHQDSQIGFCAMWFDESVKPIWSNSIEPAIKNAGYAPKRIDTHHHNNRIDDEIIAMLRRSKFVVADFTGQRGGVYFEAGFALGLGLQVIWTCKKSELDEKKIHFDTRQYNFVTWDEDKLDDFKIALQNRIEATIGRGNLS